MDGPSGPLDYARNEDNFKDANNHKMQKMNEKISQNLMQMQDKKRQVDSLQEKAQVAGAQTQMYFNNTGGAAAGGSVRQMQPKSEYEQK
jgi:hypothetical protein